MFAKKRPTVPERTRRPVQQPVQRSAVFSYHANRSPRAGTSSRDIQQPEKVQRTGPRFPVLKQVPQLAALLAVLILVVLSLRLTSDAKVLPVEGSPGQVFLRDQQVYAAAAKKSFSGSVNANKLTVDTAKISADLKRQFPELQAVTISLPFIGSQPVVYVQPATPKLILAGADNSLYVLDSAGRALISGNQVPQLEELAIPVVTDQSNIQLSVGRIALPGATVRFIDEVVFQLTTKGIAIESLSLPAGTNELHVRPKGAGYIVKYNLYGNAREEAGAHIALKERLAKERKTPKEYVDVRVENRVYYK
ncbi:MAG TPA: hypothetical protein VD735_07380 [Candidatus Saccharimonadales bacterium]|nr:hypothetical protein [Candidatus Saccharimonadales bacterium]